jgi:D-tyrosyl-tRNA(Tyr) deacylase
MRAVVQRCDGARVVVDGATVAEIDGPGLVALVGVTHDDTPALAVRLATKIHELRIFEPRHSREPVTDGRRELSAAELGLPVLVVSQFTLYGDTRKGRRPSWVGAAPGEVAEPLVAAVADELRARGAQVGTGVFGADMAVELVNDGPMTLVLEVASD